MATGFLCHSVESQRDRYVYVKGRSRDPWHAICLGDLIKGRQGHISTDSQLL